MCVLLVEDESCIRETMAEMLRDAGFQVVEAEDGTRALDFMRGAPAAPTILVTDLQMPGSVDGSQLAARVRGIRPDLPVVIATGRPDKLQPSWRTELGYVFVTKPYLPSQLVRLVRGLV